MSIRMATLDGPINREKLKESLLEVMEFKELSIPKIAKEIGISVITLKTFLYAQRKINFKSTLLIRKYVCSGLLEIEKARKRRVF